MQWRWLLRVLAVSAAVAGAGACAVLAGLDDYNRVEGPRPTGDGGAPASCTDCPVVDAFCATRSCDDGVCSVAYAPAGPIASQTYGDCKRRECDGVGNLVEVGDPTDTYSDGLECTLDVCEGGALVHHTKDQGEPCGGGSGWVCDADGRCVECMSDSTCGGFSDCIDGQCVSTICNDMMDSRNESDIDCGGPCKPCEPGKHCGGADANCTSGVCEDGVCEPPACNDSVKNGAEGDVDCGGLECSRCADGASCNTHTDCQSGVCYCAGGICTSPDQPYECLPPTCVDGTQNGDEEGIDCGGSCGLDCL